MLNKSNLELIDSIGLDNIDLSKISSVPSIHFTKAQNINSAISADITTGKTNLTRSGRNINAVITTNNIYSAGTVSAGDQLLLQIMTKNKTKLSVQTTFNNNVSYVTTVFYVQNGAINIVTQSQNLLGNFDITSFLPEGGVYYIQINILSGSGALKFVVPEFSNYDGSEPVDNLFQAIKLTPGESIKAVNFFDNALDFDFYAINSPAENSIAYVNFNFSNSSLMNVMHEDAPEVENAKVELMGFYVNENNSIAWQIDETFLYSLVEHKVVLPNKGKYILAVRDINQFKQGQIREEYNISVAFKKTVITNLVSSNVKFMLATYQGTYNEGRYDTDVNINGGGSSFWVNGCAVLLSGHALNWENGKTGQAIARVKNKYGEITLTCVNINSEGFYDVMIPLPKCQNRDNYAMYHGEKLEWNTLDFIGAADIDVLDHPDISVYPLYHTIIGVYYDPIDHNA